MLANEEPPLRTPFPKRVMVIPVPIFVFVPIEIRVPKWFRVGANWGLRILLFSFEAMFDGGRMVREVGPGLRPEERYEFEKAHRDQLGRGYF